MTANKYKYLTIKITLFFILILTISSSPFIFLYLPFANSEFRGVLGVICILLLNLYNTKFKLLDIFFISLAIFFIALEIYFGNKINNILSYYALIIIFILFFRALKKHKIYRYIFRNMWISISYYISISAILLFFIDQFTSINTDILNFYSNLDLGSTALRYSIFGVTETKYIGSFQLTRVYGYFAEPQYAGFYFFINLILANYIPKFKNFRLWVKLNLLAGILTLSTTFFVLIILYYFLYLAKLQTRIILFLIMIIFLFIIDNNDTVSSSFKSLTSFSDRNNRLAIAFDVLDKASLENFIFGHGVGYEDNFKYGFSAGFLLVWIERGFIGLIFVITLLAYTIRDNYRIYFFLFLYLMAAPFYVNYLFWNSCLILWLGSELANNKLHLKRITNV